MGYEFFYPGSYSSLDPESGELFSGYRIPAGNLGIPTSIQTANQIQEVTNTLNQGGKFIELQPIQPEVFEQIPKQHFREINRLTRLTGSATSMHAPMIDPAGFAKEGWSEMNRTEAEMQLMSVMEKSHELDPTGRVNVTIHASGVPGAEFSKPSKEMADTYKKQFRDRYGREPRAEDLRQLEVSQLTVVNQETGQLVPLKREEKVYPQTGYPVLRIPEQEIDTINHSEWINSITNLAFYKKEADEVLGGSQAQLQPLFDKLEQNKPISQEEYQQYGGAIEHLKKADLFLDNVETSFVGLYNKAYKYGDEETKRALIKISEDWKKQAEEERKIAMKIHKGEASPLDSLQFVVKKSELIDDTLAKLREGVRTKEGILRVNEPEVYKKVEDFAVDKSAETLGNIAFKAYDKYKNNAPIVSVENLYPGMAFSRSEELKKLIEKSREKFVENAKKNGMDEGEAKKLAERQIGVTWDVGHLNMLRKGGFEPEELVKETDAMAKYIKHVHITDNFGFSDSHLPPGMGNVPIKEIMEQLEKAGYSGKEIIEAGGFVQHFKTSPTKSVLESFGSPMYSEGGPYWNQMRTGYGEYASGPMAVFPEQHFSIYGPGFSGLPTELGGQMPGKQSRLTGTPME